MNGAYWKERVKQKKMETMATRCSECKLWSYKPLLFTDYKFCPHCGARMEMKANVEKKNDHH